MQKICFQIPFRVWNSDHCVPYKETKRMFLNGGAQKMCNSKGSKGFNKHKSSVDAIAIFESCIARIANAVHCHSWLSGSKDCHEFRFSIVTIVISVSNVSRIFKFSKIVKFVNNWPTCQNLSCLWTAKNDLSRDDGTLLSHFQSKRKSATFAFYIYWQDLK